MKMYGRLLLVVLAALALTVSGCKTSQPGVTNSWGTLETLVEAPPQAVTRAATEALQDLDLIVISSQATNLSGEVIARTPDDKRVTVTVSPRPNNLSEINVRTGHMGDSAMSQRIINRIKAKLYGNQPDKGQFQRQQQNTMQGSSQGTMNQ